MGRGRPRKHDPSIPAHIDQTRLPAGMLWDRSGTGRWYMRSVDAEGRIRATTVAGRDARLSELHAIAEDRGGGPVRGTIGYLIDHFHAHREFKDLAETSRKRYAEHAAGIKAYPTKRGPLGTVKVDSITQPYIRKLVDQIADGRPATKPGEEATPPYPTKANAWLRYLRRLFSFGIERGLNKTNPARGVRQVKEVRNARMPTPEAFRRIYDYAKACSELQPREKGRQPPYLWAAMELAFQARLRRIEVITLHDGQVTEVLASEPDGDAVSLLETRRRKGSRDNQVRMGERMREAIAALQAHRATIWARKHMPTPIRPEQRALFVSEDGTPLTRDGFKSSWGKMMRAALKAGIIAPEDRFAMHGLKHRGVTDTKGTRAEKKHASGHVTDSMASLYDHDLPMVEPADD